MTEEKMGLLFNLFIPFDRVWNSQLSCLEHKKCQKKLSTHYDWGHDRCFSNFSLETRKMNKAGPCRTSWLISHLRTVMSIYRLHILKSIAGSPIKRHFRRKVLRGPHKLFSFVRRRFKEKLPKICDFGLCLRVIKWL